MTDVEAEIGVLVGREGGDEKWWRFVEVASPETD